MPDAPRPAGGAEPQGLPENAFRELAPGEGYRPVVPASESPPEVTVRSVVQGLVWSVVFSAAATYIVLKLGQGIESAIPIAILAAGASALLVKAFGARASTLSENVNVLAVGATSGIVAGGSVFTMPAIFILGLEAGGSFWQVFLVPLLGALLGVFFLAPFRRYFTRDLHGKLPSVRKPCAPGPAIPGTGVRTPPAPRDGVRRSTHRTSDVRRLSENRPGEFE